MDLNEKICKLDSIIRVNVYEEGRYVKYNTPNQLQTELGWTVSINNELETDSYVSYRNLDFLARVINDLCQKKNYETDFLEQYQLIGEKLSSKEFELDKEDKPIINVDMENLILKLNGEDSEEYKKIKNTVHPTYKKEKLEEAYNLKKTQVEILLNAFYELTRHMSDNNMDVDCKYVSSYTSTYYDDYTTTEWVVKDSYMAAFESLLNCCKIIDGKEYMNNYGTSVIKVAEGITKKSSKNR